ncbi:MAG: ester cyclase [Bacteroidota bacterium]|nr:ester cyclase [Bacteroidota bacterium]
MNLTTAVATPSLEANKQLVLRHFNEVINQKQLDVIEQIFAEDFYSVAPNGQVVEGRENLSNYLGYFFSAFPDLHMSVEEMIAENETVVARIKVSGTQQGEFWGIPATHKSITIQEVFIVKVVNNWVVEARPMPDLYSLFQQLNSN